MTFENLIKLIIVIVSLSMFGALVGYVIIYGVTDKNHDIVNQALIALIGWNGLTIGYYFGSSSGSAAKSVQIAQQLNPTPDVPKVAA